MKSIHLKALAWIGLPDGTAKIIGYNEHGEHKMRQDTHYASAGGEFTTDRKIAFEIIADGAAERVE